MVTQETIDDFNNHVDNLRKALQIAIKHAEVSSPDIDDKAFWEHELRALNRIAEGFGPGELTLISAPTKI